MIISIFGRTGQGKTVLSRLIAKEINRLTNKPVYEYSPFEKTEFSEFSEFKTNSVYLINEMQIFASILKKDSLLKVITGNRHYNLDIIFNSQRPALVSRTLTSLSNKIFVFNLIENVDLQYVRLMSNTDIEDIKKLNVFEFYDILSDKKFFIDINKKMVYPVDMKGVI